MRKIMLLTGCIATAQLACSETTPAIKKEALDYISLTQSGLDMNTLISLINEAVEKGNKRQSRKHNQRTMVSSKEFSQLYESYKKELASQDTIYLGDTNRSKITQQYFLIMSYYFRLITLVCPGFLEPMNTMVYHDIKVVTKGDLVSAFEHCYLRKKSVNYAFQIMAKTKIDSPTT